MGPAAAVPEDAIDDIVAAVDDATANRVEHAYRDIDPPGELYIELSCAHGTPSTQRITISAGSPAPAPGDPHRTSPATAGGDLGDRR